MKKNLVMCMVLAIIFTLVSAPVTVKAAPSAKQGVYDLTEMEYKGKIDYEIVKLIEACEALPTFESIDEITINDLAHSIICNKHSQNEKWVDTDELSLGDGSYQYAYSSSLKQIEDYAKACINSKISIDTESYYSSYVPLSTEKWINDRLTWDEMWLSSEYEDIITQLQKQDNRYIINTLPLLNWGTYGPIYYKNQKIGKWSMLTEVMNGFSEIYVDLSKLDQFQYIIEEDNSGKLNVISKTPISKGYSDNLNIVPDKNEIMVLLNGGQLKFDQLPVTESGRTLVPMRAIFEAMDATVEWEAESKTITASAGSNKIILKIGNKNMTVNGKQVALDVSPKIIGERTLVPVRAISESLGADVTWDSEARKVSILQIPIMHDENTDKFIKWVESCRIDWTAEANYALSLEPSISDLSKHFANDVLIGKLIGDKFSGTTEVITPGKWFENGKNCTMDLNIYFKINTILSASAEMKEAKKNSNRVLELYAKNAKIQDYGVAMEIFQAIKNTVAHKTKAECMANPFLKKYEDYGNNVTDADTMISIFEQDAYQDMFEIAFDHENNIAYINNMLSIYKDYDTADAVINWMLDLTGANLKGWEVQKSFNKAAENIK